MNKENIEQVISIKNLSKEFEGNKIFTNLNLNVEAEQIIAILGPSGCGKTTMLRMICGLEISEKNSIYFKGQDICELNSNGEIGFIFQKPILFPHLNVGKNILLGSNVKNYKKTNIEIIVIISNANGEERERAFNESFTYDNKENKFDLAKYQKEIKNNLVNDIVEKLIVYINLK